MDYSEKLKSPKWQKKRLEVLNRDSFTCCKCGDTETELHVHHLKYTKEPYDADLKDLETLCKHCHYYFTFIHKEFINSYNIDSNQKFIIHRIANSKIIEFVNLVFVLIILDNELVFHSCFYKNSEVLKKLTSIINS